MYIYMNDDLRSAVYVRKAAGHIIHKGPLHISIYIYTHITSIQPKPTKKNAYSPTTQSKSPKGHELNSKLRNPVGPNAFLPASVFEKSERTSSFFARSSGVLPCKHSGLVLNEVAFWIRMSLFLACCCLTNADKSPGFGLKGKYSRQPCIVMQQV